MCSSLTSQHSFAAYHPTARRWRHIGRQLREAAERPTHGEPVGNKERLIRQLQSSLAALIREVIYWPLNAEPQDVGEAVNLAIERYRVPPTPSVGSIIGSPVTPATSAVLSPPLSTEGIVDSTESLADDLAELALSPI